MSYSQESRADAFGVTVWSSKSTAITWGVGGCAGGALAGAGIGVSGRQSDPDVDVLKNVGVYGIAGCALGILAGQLFGDDSSEQDQAKRVNELRAQIRAANVRLSEAWLAKASARPSHLQPLSAQQPMPIAETGGFQLTSKRSVALWASTGCASGMLVGTGLGISGKKSDPDVDVLKNVGVYGLLGCGLGLFGVGVFGDDVSEKQLQTRIVSLSNTLENLNHRLAQAGLEPVKESTASLPASKSARTDRNNSNSFEKLAQAFGGVNVDFDRVSKHAPQGASFLRPRTKSLLIGQPGLSEKTILERRFVPVSPRLALQPFRVQFSDVDLYSPDAEVGFLSEHYGWLECFLLRVASDQLAAEKLAPPACQGDSGNQPARNPAFNKRILDIHGLVNVPWARLLGKSAAQTPVGDTHLLSFVIAAPAQGEPQKEFLAVTSRAAISPLSGQIADRDLFAPDPDVGYLGDRYPWFECLVLRSIQEKAKAFQSIEIEFEQCRS